ncbi:hypothetical protein RND71_012831 [Anisodus tanguticus]|uniref:tRNA synthetases class I catalytic domain-containing protein n=1 Tax=Anisodus tanguticus TaxID=243964 RepID=A0AAE1VQ83_9SOLA|nr:hypothetical protein RND71_012831 [Anisodus tanguticus]
MAMAGREEFRVFNTKTKKKEVFQSKEPGKVKCMFVELHLILSVTWGMLVPMLPSTFSTVSPPTHQLRVTEHMEQIKDMINKIITNGCGYKIDGDVYFSIDSFAKYGRGLSAVRKLKDDISGKRVKVDSRKRNPADFALWKAAKPGEPS